MMMYGSKESLIKKRREAVSKMRLRGFSYRAIAEGLFKAEIYNPDSSDGRWSHVTVKRDCDANERMWMITANVNTDNHRARQFNELMELKSTAYSRSDPELALKVLDREMKLLGTLAPLNVNINQLNQVVILAQLNNVNLSDLFQSLIEELRIEIEATGDYIPRLESSG